MTWTQTFTGKKFDIFNPDPAAICIEDIAHHLSQINRFNGGTPFPYSVAQHSIMVSRLCPAGHELAGLLHDAAEAYIGDWPGPWKEEVHIGCIDILEIEKGVNDVICRAIGCRLLDYDFNNEFVCRADKSALATERRDLMPGEHVWPSDDDQVEPDPWPIREHTAIEAEFVFLNRFKELTQNV